MEKLVNLSEIYLDIKPFDFSNIFEYCNQQFSNININDRIPIPDLPKLKSVSFHTGIFYKHEDLKFDWKKIFKNHYLFSKIKMRIIKVLLNESSSFPIIQVTLNV